MTRTPLLISGLGFGLFSLVAYPLLGWQLDGWLLCLVAVIHLGVVMKFYPRVDNFLITLHYLIGLISLGGILLIIGSVTGPAAGFTNTLSALLKEQWWHPSTYLLFALVLLLTLLILLAGATAWAWLIRRRTPNKKELTASLFVGSILVFPCYFALHDALGGIAVLDPDAASSFVWAVGISSLGTPAVLHLLIGVPAAISGIQASGAKP